MFWLWPMVLLLALMARPVALLAEPAQSESATPLTVETVEAYFDVKLAQQMADDHIVGATVAVVQEGELLFAKGYGYADLAQGKPVVVDQTLFFPGSVGKLFTWTAVMQLAEQGKLDLDADINDYLDFTIPAMLYPRRGSDWGSGWGSGCRPHHPGTPDDAHSRFRGTVGGHPRCRPGRSPAAA